MNKFPVLYLLCFINILIGTAQVDTPDPHTMVRFTENKNQWEEQVLYRAQLDGGALFLEKNCFTYNFYDKETLRHQHASISKNERNKHLKLQKLVNQEGLEGSDIRSHAFRLNFLNANEKVVTSAKQMTLDYCNYFIGNDQRKWAGNVKNYKEVNYKNLYEGIDLQILGLQNSLKYNFYVAVGADVNKIKLSYEGLDKLKISHGALILTTSLNTLVEQKPFAYQLINGDRIKVPCEFVLDSNTVSFNFPKGYKKDLELVIDPVLIFAASSGSLADNFGMTATYDADGNLYSGGTVFDQGYPTTLGAYDRTFNGAVAYGQSDVVITKYDSSGTFLHYSTYLGGTLSSEIVTSIVVNAQNELFLYGATGSPDFPITNNAYDPSFNGGTQLTFTPNGTYFFGGTDIYVSKFNSSGTALLASTYIGGSANDGVNINNTAELIPPDGIWLGRQVVNTNNPAVVNNTVDFFPKVFNDADGLWYGYVESKHDSLQYNYGDQYRGEINVDKYGNVCIASSTRSADFPTDNGFDKTLNGKQDAVVFKLNRGLTSLLWSTYLGGDDNDAGYALAIDDSANVYVTGGTRSAGNFPTTPGVIHPTYMGGKADGFITKIKNDGSSILASTYLGTSAYDQSYFIQIDRDNDVYVVGQSEGSMPVTAGVYNNPNSGQFITKMNESLNSEIFSTVFGNGNGDPNISPSAFLVDVCENIYVSGWGGSIISQIPTTGMPLTPDASQSTTDGFNFYLFVVSPDADSLIYASYFGGNQSQEHVDGGTSRFDKRGIIYQSVCAGCGGNDDFPVTPGAWPNTGADVNHNDNCNNGVFKFDFNVPLVFADIGFDIQTSGCIPHVVQFNNLSTSGAPHMWDFGGGDTTTVQNPTRTYNVPGIYEVKLFAIDTSTCNYTDSTFVLITVEAPPEIIQPSSLDTTICEKSILSIPLVADVPSSYTWIAADNPNVTGESTSIQTTNSINDFLQNTSTVPQVVTYTITPYSIDGLCIGTPSTFTVNVVPLPELVLGTDTTICESVALNIPLNSSTPSTYTWVANNNPAVIGESTTVQNSDTIKNVLENSSLLMQVVTYTVTPFSTIGGCAGDSETYPVNIFPTPVLSNSTDTAICSESPFNIVFNTNVASSFTWNTTDNPAVSGESLLPQNSATITDLLQNNSSSAQTITYTVTPVSITANCSGQPFPISVTINPIPVLSPIPDTTICGGEQLNIGINTNIASSYTWVASANPSIVGESSNVQLTDTINDNLQNHTIALQVITYTVSSTSILGACKGSSIQFDVDVLATPVLTNNTDVELCVNGILNLPLKGSIPSVYTWIAADNPNVTRESLVLKNTNSINDPLLNTTTVNQIVNYTVTPTSVFGNCLGQPENVNVELIPAPVILFNPDTTICNQEVLDISFSSNIPSSFSWIAADNPTINGESLTIQTRDTLDDILQNNVAIKEMVTYTITPVSIAANCFGVPFTYSVIVNPALTADLTFTHNACIYEATFKDASIHLPINWLWDFGDGTTDSNQNPPSHIYNSPGTFTVTLTVNDDNNCQDTVMLPLDFTEPLVTISQGSTICTNEQIQLVASGGVAYDWSPVVGLDNPSINNPVASPVITTTYTVNITTIPPLGDSCSKTLTTTVNVTDPSLFSISATVDRDTIFRGQSTTIHAILSDTSKMVNWQASSKATIPSLKNVEVSPEMNTTYTATVQLAGGCSKSGTVDIFVIACDPATVYVPNTFTPNGDGKNDVLYVRANEITDLYFAVYNRWGEMVFETTDIKNGWDGVFKNMNSDPVVFAWYLRAKCYDGFEFEKKGNVSLIR